MPKTTPEAPRPWAEQLGETGDGVVGKLFRSVSEPEALSAASLAQIHARLGKPRAASAMRRRVREATLAFAMLLVGASVALAGWGVSSLWSAQHEAAQPGPASLSTVKAGVRASQAPMHSARSSAAIVPTEPDSEVDSGMPSIIENPAPLLRAPSAGAASAPASPASSTLAAEAAALERVLLKLRREHDPAGALALLDESNALFARGSLALEARVARLDALLALGRKQEALAILERLPFAQIGRSGELRLVRAELRASTDCGSALADFDLLAHQSLAPALAERALYGRAACEVQVGDTAHAQSDFARYQKLYPQGRFAALVQQQLGSAAGKAQ